MDPVPARLSDVPPSTLPARLLMGVVRGTLRHAADVRPYTKEIDARAELTDAVFHHISGGFAYNGVACPRSAAQAIAHKNEWGLTPEDRELVFRTIVTDVPGFLTWCFPLFTGLSILLQTERVFNAAQFLRTWIDDRVPRWLIAHVLLHRHRTDDDNRIRVEDFSLAPPLTGLMATLHEFGVLDAWLDDAAMKTDAAALYREFAQRLIPEGEGGETPIWARGSARSVPLVAIRHCLILSAQDAHQLWCVLRNHPLVRETGRVDRARVRLGKSLVTALATAGYLAVLDADTVELDREKFRRSVIIPAESCGWTPAMPRVREAPRRVFHARSWVDVIECGREHAAAIDRGAWQLSPKPAAPKHASAHTVIVPAHAERPAPPARPVAPPLPPRLAAAVPLTTQLHLTRSEATALLAIAETLVDRPMNLASLRQPLVRHLAGAGYITIGADGVPGALDPARFEQTVFDICDADVALFANRFTPFLSEKTDRSWYIRLRRAVDRAKKRAATRETVVAAAYRFRVTRREAMMLLRLATLSPFTLEEIAQCLEPDFREVLRTLDYLRRDYAFPYRFQRTRFEAIPTAPIDAAQRFEEIADADRCDIPTTRWFEDIRTIVHRAA